MMDEDKWRDFDVDGELAVIEGDERKDMDSYLEMLDWVIRRTYEISVNSPEEYDELNIKDKAKLDDVHRIWM